MNCRRLAQGTSLYYHPWGGVWGGGRIFGGIAWFSGEIELGGVGFEGFWGDHMVFRGDRRGSVVSNNG